MIVEFLAGPGTGKSYLSKQLQSALAKDGFSSTLTNEKYFRTGNQYVWRFKKIINSLFYLLSKPRVFKFVVKVLEEPIPFKFKLSTIYNSLSVLAAISTRSKDKVSIRDEGIYQILFAIALFCKNDVYEYYKILSSYITKPNLVVLLSSDYSVKENLRQQNRGGRIRKYLFNKTLSEEGIISTLKKIEDLVKLEAIQVLKIDYKKSKAGAKDAVEQIVNRLN